MGSDNRQRTRLIPVRVNEDELKVIDEGPGLRLYDVAICVAARPGAGHRAQEHAGSAGGAGSVKDQRGLGSLGRFAQALVASEGAKPSEAIEIRSLMDDLVRTQDLLRRKVLSL